MMSTWMCNKFADQLATLDNRVFLALSCLTPWPQQVIVSNYTSPAQAQSAFMATGTYAEAYNGMLCTDGGAESGPDMTPLFHDNLHPQVMQEDTSFIYSFLFNFFLKQQI